MGRQMKEALIKALGKTRPELPKEKSGSGGGSGTKLTPAPPIASSVQGTTPDCRREGRKEAAKKVAPRTLRPAAPAPKPGVRARLTGRFTLHELFSRSSRATFQRLRPRLDGIAPEIAKNPTNAADLILGLDFGTSTVKAVIRDHTAGQSYAVPFESDARNPYLLPARVFRSPAGYSLDAGLERVANLKLGLLHCSAKLPVQEFNDACAFLALVIRHCRGWLLDRYGKIYGDHQLTWSVNLGLPARSYEDDDRVKLFRRLGWAAANLAADGNCRQIKEEDVTLFRQLSLEAYKHGEAEETLGDFEFRPREVDVVPEIAAQVFCFVHSSSWDSLRQPRFLLVDVGAGTVDTAFFALLEEPEDALRFVFYSTEVSPLGVINLHEARIGWIQKALRAGAISEPAIDRLVHGLRTLPGEFPVVPERVEDYAAGLVFDLPAGDRTIDEQFFHSELVPQAGDCLRQGKVEQGFSWRKLEGTPIFVCGGGARMRLYGRIPEGLNQKLRGSGSVEPTPLPIPPRFEAPGLERVEYDRLSVAYGLSWQGAGGRKLGEMIRREQITPLPVSERASFTDRYISKDQV